MKPPVVPGIPFVISGPSGVGKTSLLEKVLERDEKLRFSVSHTTRPPRAGEQDGVHYHFVDSKAFRHMIEKEDFLEWVEYQGNLYGTSRDAVTGPTSQGIDVILEVEVQGARYLREQLPEAITVFVLPPASFSDLERRLRGRRSDQEDAIQKRLATARREIREAERYHYVIVNEDLEQAARDLLHIVACARLASGRVLPRWKAAFAMEA